MHLYFSKSLTTWQPESQIDLYLNGSSPPERIITIHQSLAISRWLEHIGSRNHIRLTYHVLTSGRRTDFNVSGRPDSVRVYWTNVLELRTYHLLGFFCSSQLQPACERGLMALCALGLISNDATLAGAALGELMKRGNGEIKQRGLKKKNVTHSSSYGISKSLEGFDREKCGVLNWWSSMQICTFPVES